MITADLGASKVWATALEMLNDHLPLRLDQKVRLPLLTLFNSSDPGEIAKGVEALLDGGFWAFKAKAGKDPDADASVSKRRLPAARRWCLAGG